MKCSVCGEEMTPIDRLESPISGEIVVMEYECACPRGFWRCIECGTPLDHNNEYHKKWGVCDARCYARMVGLEE